MKCERRLKVGGDRKHFNGQKLTARSHRATESQRGRRHIRTIHATDQATHASVRVRVTGQV